VVKISNHFKNATILSLPFLRDVSLKDLRSLV
jgi:hypothetical protein